MYKCPCGATHTNAEWNRATRNRYNNDIMPISDVDAGHASFICPSCLMGFERSELEKVTRRKEAKEIRT